MTQLTDKIREALLGNVGTIICGRIGVTDAELMVKAFTPTFTAEDLTKTPNFAAVAKVMMFDMPSAPFTMSLPAPMGEPNDELMETLKAYSATKYAKTRAEVEKEIQDRWTAASKAKQEASPEATGDAPSPVSTKSAMDAGFGTDAAPSAEEEPKKGFLDNWLSKKPAPAPAAPAPAAPAPEPSAPTAPAAPAPEPTPAPAPVTPEPVPTPAPAPQNPDEVVFKIR